jgi:anti-anti-sigma factor
MSPDRKPAGRASAIRVGCKEGVCVVSFPGKNLQKLEAEELLRATHQESGVTRLVLDLSDCEYISSEGLGATARCWKLCHEDGKGQMAVVLPSSPVSEVRNLFEIIGLSRMIGSAIQPTVNDAIAYIQKFS